MAVKGWVVRDQDYFTERYRGGRKAERQEEYDEFIDFLKDLSEEGKDAVAEFPIPKELKEDSVSTGIYAAAKRKSLKVNIARTGVSKNTLLVRLGAVSGASEETEAA